jgi:hypothetical protein
VSPGFRLRGASPASIGPLRLTSTAASPSIGAAGISLGQADALGPVGSGVTLRSAYGGFWPLAVGALPSLDLDADGRPAFLDPDDDGDGLLDVVETGTGIFVSASDTGTGSAKRDTDGDGFHDGVEVTAGSDPNDPDSRPISVPALSALARTTLMLVLIATGGRVLRRRSTHD